MEVIEIFTKGCIHCDYIYRLQKKLEMYDKITHIEHGTEEEKKYLNYNITKAPTFLIIIDNHLFKKYENVERKDLEEIKMFL